MKLIVADDHPIVLNGLCLYLENKGYTIMASCINGIEAWNQINLHLPDIAILDHNMPGMTGVEIAEKVIEKRLRVETVLLTMHNERSLLAKAMEVGIKGFLLKDSALLEIEKCLKEVSKHKTYLSTDLTQKLTDTRNTGEIEELKNLSPSERKILNYIAEEKTSSEIAAMLFISEKTVEKHRKNIIDKLKIPHSKNSLLMWAIKHLKNKS